MSEKKYARIENGLVAELLVTDGNISEMFVPGIVWIDVSSVRNVSEGWRFEGGQFIQPALPERSNNSSPSLKELQQQLAALGARVAELEKPS